MIPGDQHAQHPPSRHRLHSEQRHENEPSRDGGGRLANVRRRGRNMRANHGR